jgi:hypothetical protein
MQLPPMSRAGDLAQSQLKPRVFWGGPPFAEVGSDGEGSVVMHEGNRM